MYIMEYYLAIQENDIMPFAATWMGLESIILTKANQTELDKYYMISLTCELYFTILYWFCHTSTWIRHGCTCVPNPEPLLPPPSLYHPSESSQCTSPKLPVSCIEPGLAIRFLYDIIHVSMPFCQIIPPSLSHRVQKTVLYICVSFAVLQTGLSLPSF